MGTDAKTTGGATEVAIKPGDKAAKVAAALTGTEDEVSSAALDALQAAADAIDDESEDIEDRDDARQIQFYAKAAEYVDLATKEITSALTEAAAAEATPGLTDSAKG